MAKNSGEFSFNDLNKEMNKNSKWGGLMSDGAGVSAITDYIPIGNYICNACLTGSIFGGIPNNRSICISGQSGVGKTYLLMNLAREAQKKNIFVIWYDSENAIEKSQLDQFGVNPSMFRYEPVGTVQEFKTSITQTLDLLIEKKEAGMQIPKCLFILDSVGNLATQKEIDDAKSASDKADMTRPKTIRSIFRIVCSKMGLIGGTFAFSNHVYQTLDLFSVTKQSGGSGLVYGASIILNLSKAKLKEGSDNTQTGIIVTAEPEKNRFCKPKKVKFYISYVNGMNPYVGLEEYISFERCGIQRGKFITEKEYLKNPNDEYIKVETPEEVKYFVPSETARNICCDNGDIFPVNKIFTPQVFTKERLERLDEYIKSEFRYSDSTSVAELFEDVDEEDDEETQEKTVDEEIKTQLLFD
jgi:RecA/RadA recombinase